MSTGKGIRVFTKNTRFNELNNGGKVMNVSLTGEQVGELIEALNNTPGQLIQLALYTEAREYQGRTFDSTNIVVSEVQLTQGQGNGAAKGKTFVPKAQQQRNAAQARNQRVRQEIEG